MGDYARSVAPETLTDTKRQAGGATPDLADLMGCRLATSTETEDGSVLAESRIKQMTGGDMLTVRKLYCAPFEFVPAFKLFMVGNHKPIIKGTDHAIWRRVRLIFFGVTFDASNGDPKLLEKLKFEAPHILAWMVEGCLEWQRRGLSDVPKVVAEQTADYRESQDVIGEWLAEKTIAKRDAETSIAELYANYVEWADGTGLKPMSRVALGRRMTERGHISCRNAVGRAWRGIAIKF